MKIYSQVGEEALSTQYFTFDNSFAPFIRFLKQKQDKSHDIREKFYRYLVKKFEHHPELSFPFTDYSVLEAHDELVQLLRMSLLPLASNSDEVPMALAFLQPSSLFYYTKKFKEIFIDENIEFNTIDDAIANLRYFVRTVLERRYQLKSDLNIKMIKQVTHVENHTLRHYQINIDSRFVDVHTTGLLPEFNEDWIHLLRVDDHEFMELFAAFPSQSFRLEGFCMLIAEDISEEMAINQLKGAVLTMHTSTMEQTFRDVEMAVGELVNDSRIKIGITPFFKINDKVVYDRSFITSCVGIPNEQKGLENGLSISNVYEQVSGSSLPIIYTSINDELVQSKPYLRGLQESNIYSLLVHPIKSRAGLLGMFEMGSPEDNFINQSTINCLRPALPLITDLINYMLEMFNARIERLVKEKFTPLQQSVEWKFNEIAWEYLVEQNSNTGNQVIKNIVFENVYPLYGAVDIRDSSIERNRASKNDYLEQLRQTRRILQKATAKAPLSLIETITFKCEQFLESITDLVTSQDEMNMTEFFEKEVYVLFEHIAATDNEFKELADDYMQHTNLVTGHFHKNHRDYDETVQAINKNMVEYFEKEINNLQKVYPFYFEKYRTDGVEYNIYIGNSIAPDKPFNALYLRNLRAWQLSSMAHITQLNHATCQSLPLCLQTTQLILVHGSAIDITFRRDEKRFDVEGAYNIRYEILKKRIDKVRIKGSMERLTQPGKIALVYSNTTEIQEYLHHIQYLQSKGLLSDTLEMLDLENVQGISGLKALRVGVQLDHEAELKISNPHFSFNKS